MFLWTRRIRLPRTNSSSVLGWNRVSVCLWLCACLPAHQDQKNHHDSPRNDKLFRCVEQIHWRLFCQLLPTHAHTRAHTHAHTATPPPAPLPTTTTSELRSQHWPPHVWPSLGSCDPLNSWVRAYVCVCVYVCVHARLWVQVLGTTKLHPRECGHNTNTHTHSLTYKHIYPDPTSHSRGCAHGAWSQH